MKVLCIFVAWAACLLFFGYMGFVGANDAPFHTPAPPAKAAYQPPYCIVQGAGLWVPCRGIQEPRDV